jgi:DNA-binding winged helix-turn-helix (wHTH) protein/Tol biopolymer transport system component
MKSDPKVVYEFGPFRMDPDQQVLLREGQPVPVTPKAFETLLVLVRRSREVVTKEELLNAVWPDSFIEEGNLSQNIFKLRRALGEPADGDRYIVTLPGRGYRFAVPVRIVREGDTGNGNREGEVLLAQTRSRTEILVEEHEPEAGPEVIDAPASAIPALPKPERSVWRWLLPVGMVAAVAIGVGAYFLHRETREFKASSAASTPWEQLTFFTDSAVYPALSSDGRILAFIRGSNSFLGPGDIYVQLLPGGKPVQLTHQRRPILAPSFSPDNSLIAYSLTDPWETWEVPVLGGEPHLLLPNSSSLTWIEGGKRLLYSEIIEGLHLKLVTSDEARGNSRDVYVPEGNRSMVHHSYLSPDGRWVLVVEMDSQGEILPCRVVPFQGPTNVTVVGPANGSCRAGAWSPDGEWIYLSAKTDDFHLWRQRFPDGKPEQLTFGPTSQEGIAMAPDGKSIITSVGSQDHSVWLHDKGGDRQVFFEGNTSSPTFSPDGHKLYFLVTDGQTHDSELWVKDLNSGNEDRVLPGYPIVKNNAIIGRRAYSVSRDGKQIVFSMADQSDPSNLSNLWIAATDRRSPPRRIPSTVQEDSPYFLPDGDLIFRAIEGGLNFLYRMKADGTGRHKILPDRILDIHAVSPDGRWVIVGLPSAEEERPAVAKAFALDGSASVPLCLMHCEIDWDSSGKVLSIRFPALTENTYLLPVLPDTGLPKIPSAPIRGIEDITALKTTVSIPWPVGSARSQTDYAYTRETTRRNLYRIRLP